MSVTNKAGLVEFAKGLVQTGEWEIISTGGTARILTENDIPCIHVENVTEFPEMMGGRLKTLHPKIFGGILASRDDPSHMDAATEHRIGLIDMVVVNLYEFGKSPCIEQIDIGGPSLIRAAAKNFRCVIVVVDPTDYDPVLNELRRSAHFSPSLKQHLATKVFHATSSYDLAIAQEFNKYDSTKTLIPLGKH